MRADGSGQKQLTFTPRRDEGEPAWSPDGARIAFSAGAAEARRDIYVMNVDGSGERRLTTLDLPVWGPRWSRDGTRIVFFEFPPGHIYVLRVAGGAPSVVNPVDRRLVIGRVFLAPDPPIAGRALTALVSVTTVSGVAVARAAVSCRATVGGKRLRVLRSGFSAERASCTWSVPQSAKRKRIVGSVSATATGKSVARRFSARVG